MKTKYFYRSFYFWMITITVVFNFIFSRFPSISTSIYADGLYQVIRFIYDYTLAYIPVPFIYLALLIVLLYIVKWIIRFPFAKSWKTYFIYIVKGVFKLIAVLVCLFYFLWGFNYHSDNLKKRLGLKIHKIDRSYLENQLTQTEKLLLEKRRSFIEDSLLITKQALPSDYEKLLRAKQKEFLTSNDIPAAKRVRVRQLKPDGFLLRFSTAGIYIPHALEGHIDGGLHPIQWPATMAHEMGHGYGITDEGECNFIGFITCILTDSPIIQYSGYLMYYRYLVNNYQRGFMRADESYTIPAVIQNDIDECRKYSSRYPDLFPAARDIIYDQYLKSHGVKEGLDSYNTIVQMVADWNHREIKIIKR